MRQRGAVLEWSERRESRRLVLGRIATTAGIIAFVAIMLGSVVAALGYQGARGEAYSPLNHWISELGQLGVSGRASVFNVGVVTGSVAFDVFMLGLAITSPSRLRWAFGPIGVISGIGGCFVGVYPMNYSDAHVFAASIFFNLGWLAVGLASISFLRIPEPRFPRWLVAVGAATVVVFIAFLVALRVDDFSRQRMASSGPIVGRPEVWLGPILEWAVLVGIMAWTLLVSLSWRATLTPKSLPLPVTQD
jgi:hypothetical membrane protein